MLTCRVCKNQKPKHQFHKNSRSSTGHDYRCKSCKREIRIAERSTPEGIAKNRENHENWEKRCPEKRSMIQTKRRVKFRQQIPSWVKNNPEELAKIKDIYKERDLLSDALEEDFAGDHIVPLTHKLVSGLHCAANLRPLPSRENSSKCNHHWPDMPDRLDYEEVKRDSEEALARLKKNQANC